MCDLSIKNLSLSAQCAYPPQKIITRKIRTFFAIIWIAEPKAALIKNAMLASALLRVRPKNSLPIYQSKRFGAQAGFCAKKVLLYLPDFRI